jgi:SAM-dependent methyltransferase
MDERKIQSEDVRAFYNKPEVVEHYRQATAHIGLWRSEVEVFTGIFSPDDRIIELGSGTGRIAIGLGDLGYKHVLGIELSREMVRTARKIARLHELSVYFRQGDATSLEFEDALFDGAIFGFNGLMQIPGREARRRAMQEIRRVIRPGGPFVFTTHDRQNPKFRKYWNKERSLWNRGKQKRELIDYGDKWEKTEHGMLFIHVPTPEEIREDLIATGWKPEWDRMRSEIALERPQTYQFSDDCRFWVARNPAAKAD